MTKARPTDGLEKATEIFKMSEELQPAYPKEVTVVDNTDWAAIEHGEASDEDVNRAAQSVGMKTLNVRQIKDYAKIAKYLKRCGMIELSRGMLAHRMHSLAQARESLLELILDPTEDKSLRVSAANVMGILVKSENQSTELDMRLESLARERAENSKPLQELPPPGMHVTIVNSPVPVPPVEKVAKPIEG